MHLRSISLKGFKSFPDRTKLDFTPGVSVIVGPNGSGKSNITDAVLWALGEQSPLAVRGQTMKDVVFAGGHGIKGSSAAEVEVVIDNSASAASGASPAKPGTRSLDSDFSEISITRRLDRDGEGGYLLNGARCRLVDVLELLSDSGLGKEMHSVVSQGKVESIVLSRPRERRLLIEEAAGLGKHRKRRRRAQLKLERTEENLSRALDVERREAAEASFAAHSQAREQLQGQLFSARSAAERIAMRLERVREAAAAAEERSGRRRQQLELLEGQLEGDAQGDPESSRLAELERELQELESRREERLRSQGAELQAQLERAQERRAELEAGVERARAELASAEASAEAARRRRQEAEHAADAARGRAAQAAAELAAIDRFPAGVGVSPGT